MARSPETVEVSVEARRLRLSNLDKVLYPGVGFTKAQVIDYYARIAPSMLPHIAGRCITMRRWPNGVEAPSFFEKRCPGHRPAWLPVGVGPGDSRGGIEYCRLEEPAALVWTANLAALELHSPMARCDDIESPTILVIDLDPGPPAAMVECCRAAVVIRDILRSVELEAFAKTSGSKGLQLYVPLNLAHTHRHASDFALAVGKLAAKQAPELIVVEMNKGLRTGKVFVDWSQNSRHKTTVAPYSLRAKTTPTVSTPVTWHEVERGCDGVPLVFQAPDVLDRVDRLGDLFAPVAELRQVLPAR